MARLIVEKIDEDPGLLQVAHENLQRWSRVRGGALPPCREEWKALPETALERVSARSSSTNRTRGSELRSSHPFAGLVSEKERRRIRDAHRA